MTNPSAVFATDPAAVTAASRAERMGARHEKHVAPPHCGDIMVGMPAEAPETIQETIAFLKRNRVIIGSVPYLYPLPGTKVYEDAKAHGTLQGDWTLDGSIPWVKLPWTESRADLYEAARRVSLAVHRNPARWLYILRHNPGMLDPRHLGKRGFEVLRALMS